MNLCLFVAEHLSVLLHISCGARLLTFDDIHFLGLKWDWFGWNTHALLIVICMM